MATMTFLLSKFDSSEGAVKQFSETWQVCESRRGKYYIALQVRASEINAWTRKCPLVSRDGSGAYATHALATADVYPWQIHFEGYEDQDGTGQKAQPLGKAILAR